jgi:wyosine [tRNA(Phe)-imidazoG37] synthetase (radical SAM superfamily)
MTTDNLHSLHERSFENNRFVYPVLSRRAGGISIGVNLNPDKICNFDCIYCQVNRTQQAETRFVDHDSLVNELDGMLDLVVSGELFQINPFAGVPRDKRRLNDIAFSGDGEPTTYKNFDELVETCAQVKRRRGLGDVKMVLITNASMFHRSHVRRGLEILDTNQGEVWAKLDAGTEAYFEQVDRTPIRFSRILENITAAAKIRPLVIQSLWMRIKGTPTTKDELSAYCDRLNEITAAGGSLKLIQIYTVARQPTESFVEPLANNEVDAIVELVRDRTGLDVAGFYGNC